MSNLIPKQAYHENEVETPRQVSRMLRFCYAVAKVGPVMRVQVTCVDNVAASLFAAGKDTGTVPDAIRAAVDIVAVGGMTTAHSLPVAGGVPPACDTIDARVDHVLVRPTFGHYFYRHALPIQLAVLARETDFPIGGVLAS